MTTRPNGEAPQPEHDLSVAGVVHDVNQMLTVITGRVELLRLGRDPAAGDLDIIALAARDAAAMLRRLTTGPRTETGQRPAPVAECLEAVALVHQPPSAGWSRSGDGAWRLEIEAPSTLTADLPAQLLREVVGNLAANAVEAMGRDGTLRLAARADRDRVVIRVRDTGPGVPDDVRESIFAAGFTSRGGRGRGVGLAASRQLLAAWGGTLDLDGGAAGGAAFVIELPAGAPTEAQAPAVAAGNLPGPVLVVDDEPSVREVLGEVLGAWGLEVETAVDAASGYAAWLSRRHPLVLADLTLPGESGLDLARRLAEDASRPAVVLMTGVDRAGEVPPEAARLCAAVLTKPLEFGGLKAVLAEAVRAAAAGEGTGS
jgi:two-component system cell cycle sensor histidine kinase/response regulator CckA